MRRFRTGNQRGLLAIWERQGLSSPSYAYILWMTNRLFGSNEVVLRMPSVLAMLAATYVLYLIAREFFSSDIAAIVAVVFCQHPTVAFAAVDARPYAFAVLVVNCTILSFLRFLKTNSTRLRHSLGGLGGGNLLLSLSFRTGASNTSARVFRLERARVEAVCAEAGNRGHRVRRDDIACRDPAGLPFPDRPIARLRACSSNRRFALHDGTRPRACVAIHRHNFRRRVAPKTESPSHESLRAGLACLFLATIPLGVLYDVSTLTSIHVFTDRYRLVAVPGIALCWGFLASCVRSKAIRAGFCVALVALTFSHFSFATLTMDNAHGYSWKYALQVADKSAAFDNAPLLICSDLTESNFEPMPADVYAATDADFAPIFYYKVHSRVVPLPRALNGEAVAQINKFLATAMPARQRFLVLGYLASVETLSWITQRTKDSYLAQNLGTTDGVTVMEYKPR